MSDGQKGSRNLARIRLVLWALVLVAAVGATIIFINQGGQPAGAAFADEFELQTTAGEDFSEADLQETPSLVFFGYTFCPDVCPTTLAETTAWRQALNLSEDDLRIIFVSVDPQRDTPEVLEQYLSAFGAPIIGLTGSEDAVEQAKSAFGAFSEKTDVQSDTDYLVNHTATVFMIDEDGDLFGTIAYGESPDTARSKIERMTS